MEFYKIGGCVRDKILGRKCSDIDWEVIGATIEDMINLGFTQVGKDFPVFLHPETGEEYSIGRIDISTGNGHQDYQFITNKNITLEQSVQRRDFTMNAIAEKEDGTYVDAVNGINDIQNKIIRHINKDNFITDPLRVLRAMRFRAQLGFEIAPETMDLMKKMVKDGMLEHLTVERVWKETEKALTNTFQSEKYFEGLRECGALKILMPELDKLFDTPEQIKYHPSGNSGKHTMIALTRVQDENSVVKFAVISHDLGKGVTPVDILPKHSGHDESGLAEIDSLCNRLKVPNEYRDFAKTFCKNHMRMARFSEMNIKKQYDMIKELSNGFKNEEVLDMFIKCFVADWTGEIEQTAWNDVEEANAITKQMRKIFNIMHGITLKDLPVETQESLSKQKGEKFGKLYRDAMISYLKLKL